MALFVHQTQVVNVIPHTTALRNMLLDFTPFVAVLGPFLSHPPSSRVSTKRNNSGSSTVQFVYETQHFVHLKHHFCYKPQPISLQKRKTFGVTSFKSNAQNDEPEIKNSKVSRPPVQISGVQHGREDVLSETHAYTSEDKDSTTVRSLAIQKLFRKWLIMLRTQTSNQTMDKNLTEKAAECATSESQEETTGTKLGKIVKSALAYFLRLDAAISIPLVIFTPWFLTVRVIHGAELANELTPLWIAGPFIAALYVKVIQRLCSLCIFCFMLAVKLIKNLPRYCLLAYKYIAEGKLSALLWALFVKPIVIIKNFDYRAFYLKQLQPLAVEMFLDFREAIWPLYCRTIRFLKRTNFIS